MSVSMQKLTLQKRLILMLSQNHPWFPWNPDQLLSTFRSSHKNLY